MLAIANFRAGKRIRRNFRKVIDIRFAEAVMHPAAPLQKPAGDDGVLLRGVKITV